MSTDAAHRSRVLRNARVMDVLLGTGGLGVLRPDAGAGAGAYAGAGDEGGDGAHGPATPLSKDSGERPGPVSGLALHQASDASTTVASGTSVTSRGQGIQNADFPPVRFSDEMKLYVDRPWPPRPPLKPAAVARSATMPARPSTSSGPGTGSTKTSGWTGLTATSASAKTSNFDKRMSKDDMYLTGYMGRPALDRKKGLQPYRIGVRGGALPTPEPSPGNHRGTSPDRTSIPARMPTPESLSSGEIPIGMAIGSPGLAPPSLSVWPESRQPQPLQRAQTQTYIQTAVPPSTHRPVQANYSTPAMPLPVGTPGVQRSKTQRRKLFGGLFGGRKHSGSDASGPEPGNAHRGEGGTVSVTTSSTVSMAAFGQSGTPSRSNTMTDRKTPKHKPIVIRSKTESSDNDSDTTSGSGLTGPSLLLDVEIPDIHLERYSVMFSGLLNTTGSSSSLLARRQATLDRLKNINDQKEDSLEVIDWSRPRRATSPQPVRSPAFTLFPPTPGGSRQGNPGQPLKPTDIDRKTTPSRLRSNTSPAPVPSPSRATFETPPQIQHTELPRKEKKSVTIVSPRSMSERERAAQVERLREQQRQQSQRPPLAGQQSFHFGPEEAGFILESPTNIGEEIVDTHPLKPTIAEPQWQIISNPTPQHQTVEASPPIAASSGASVATAKRSGSVSTTASSSANTHITRPSLEIEEGDPTLKAAVEISIARQISISRQQRQMLRPLQTAMPPSGIPVSVSPGHGSRNRSVSSAGGVGNKVNPGAKRIVPLGRNERVAETKHSTPTLVVPRETFDSQMLQHRKSARAVLEDS